MRRASPDTDRFSGSSFFPNDLPVHAWIWFGLYATDGGLRAFTYVLEAFGRREIEILDAERAGARELRAFTSSMTSYVLECDQTFENGQTIGSSENDNHAVTLSEGAALSRMTLKIAYGNGTPAA